MKIPNKFKLNTEDFKVYFDNNKKTYVAENIETGEKTNIGVLGVLMQMGILKAIDEKEEKRIESILEKLRKLEEKVDGMTKEKESTETKEEQKEIREETEEEKKSEIKERIIDNVLKQAEKESEEEKPKEKKEENEPIIVESDEEIENWMKI